MINTKSIAYKYLKACIFIVIVPIIVINIVLNNLYINTLLESSTDKILQNLEQISMKIDNEEGARALTASTIANDNEIMDLVTQWNLSQNLNNRTLISNQINAKIVNLISYTEDIDNIIFFYRGKGYYCYNNKPTVSEDKLRKEAWYNSPKVDKGKAVVLNSLQGITEESKDKYVFSVAVKPVFSEYKNDVEMIYFSFTTSIFDNAYAGMRFNSLGEIYILNDVDKVIVSKDKKFIGSNSKDFDYFEEALNHIGQSFATTIQGKKMFVTTLGAHGDRWNIIDIVSYNELTKDVKKVLNFSIIFSAVIIVLFIAFSILFFRGILIPINNLTKKMKIVEKGDFNTTIDVRGDDEIYDLGKSFNRMVSEIKKLMNERDFKEREKNKAEIEALQSQINPHFISNTLNSIRLMAMIAKIDSIKNMTEAFIKLLSASFSRGGVLTTIEMELDILKNYIYIMKVRFGDKFEIVFEVDEDIQNYYILKLVLQPILENAILHGINEMEEKGLIRVKGHRYHNDLMFEVIDNGRGMTPEEVNNLMSEDYRNTKGFSSIGLLNVDKRIKLNHGDKYGLQIESVYGEYTNVKILLPIILFGQGGNNNA